MSGLNVGPSGVRFGQPERDATEPASVLAELDAGRLRAASPDPTASGGWRIDASVKSAILDLFGRQAISTWEVGPFAFADRASLPLKELLGGPDARSAAESGRPWRMVPGGTSIRAGVHLEPGVVVMPPSFINVGAWIGAGSMVDSHVLVGSCAQIGARVHLAAGAIIGGVLEPAGARPVIVEDDAFIGGGVGLYDGVLVGHGAVVAAGVILTGTSWLFDLVRERIIKGTLADPLTVPPMSVLVPGTRPSGGSFAAAHGLGITTAIIVKDRDAGTDARVALEEALR